MTTFLGRINALLSTGELVVTSSTRQVDLRQMLDTVLRPFIDPAKASPITLDGPPLLLPEPTFVASTFIIPIFPIKQSLTF